MAALIYCQQVLKIDNQSENNVAFITLAFSQLFHVFNMSSVGSNLFVNDVTKNKFVWFAILICTGIMALIYLVPQMRLVLGLVELPLNVWLVCMVASLLPLLIIQIYKRVFER
jgi:P-type Ca2+ transporter type 2C